MNVEANVAATATTAGETATLERIRASNWSGSIPVIVTLAPTSLSSPTIPAPIHALIPRNSFLHVGLQDVVQRLHPFAPPTFSFAKRVVEEPDTIEEKESTTNNEEAKNSPPNSAQIPPEKPYPICWFEDEHSELPLQWQMFAGVLWDSHVKLRSVSNHQASGNQLPWKIRLHFTQYPTSQLLELSLDANQSILTTVERTFRNSLKQSLVLQHGHNRVALNMTKQSHQRLWDSIVTSKYSLYQPIQEDIQAVAPKHAKKPLLCIPVRVIVDPSQPLVQKRCDPGSIPTLGHLFQAWFPDSFARQTMIQEIDSDSSYSSGVDDTFVIRPINTHVSWRIGGVTPALSTSLVDLWQSLGHPDGFLYIALTLQ
eukprot:Nitzschia sp. Nitz4//scaffold89_size161592//147192//148298//NITZ4_002402-RA/size161592-processed-gene-0.62-mRNA-1//-1//CDS//3329559688//4874//frame0